MGYFVVVISLFAASVASTSAVSSVISTFDKASIPEDGSDTSIAQMDSDELVNYVPSEIDYANYLRNFPDWSIYKRAPLGFVGMRGKKDYDYLDYSRRALDGMGPRVRILRPNFKRIPQPIPKPDNKRVPTGFIGVYGKKDLSDLDQYDTMSDNFPGNYNSLYDTYDENHFADWHDLGEASKRAPGAGFFGMRGKRLYKAEPHPDDDIYYKRAPTGFVGMRGKRVYDQYYDSIDEEKRQPKGFFGMRGKKDDSMQMDEKRSLAQFFGIRGKKQPFNSGFFGMRGKKQPFQFRTKFVGVRGKKSFDGSLQHPEMEYESEVPESSNVNLLDDKTKRRPSGFVGMRGKKDSESSSMEK